MGNENNFSVQCQVYPSPVLHGLSGRAKRASFYTHTQADRLYIYILSTQFFSNSKVISSSPRGTHSTFYIKLHNILSRLFFLCSYSGGFLVSLKGDLRLGIRG